MSNFYEQFEPEDFFQTKKEGRQQRKIAKAKDRSKYKKTDREKFQKPEDLHKNIKMNKEELSKGRVLSIGSQGILVDSDQQIYQCFLRGLLKYEKGEEKNLVVVGDLVLFKKINQKEGHIVHVEPRQSLLARADNLSRRKQQLIAANIDQVLITVSIVNPPLKPFLVDRYIIAAYKGGMEPIIILNKIDLLEDSTFDSVLRLKEKELLEEFLRAYQQAGIKVVTLSVEKKVNIDLLKQVMKNKVSVFSGQSGVGKSSLINEITGLNLRIGDIVEKTKKGSHTTTMAHLIPLDFGGWCIDTPGIKSFGVWNLKRDEVESYFSEIHEIGSGCKFPDCMHRHEKQCAVLKAIEEGKISPLRYDSYQSLMDTIQEEHVRR